MKEYHKIQTVFKRDPDNNYKTLLEGEFSLPEFEYLANNTWEFTEKVDGTNIRIMWDGSEIKIGGKTDRAQIPAFLVNRLTDIFLPLKQRFSETFISDKDSHEMPDVCFYGEGYGAKIQKIGSNYRQDQDFVLFDIKIGNFWLQRKDVVDLAESFNLDVVPIIGEGTLFDAVEKTRKGFNSQWGDFTAEGIVARPKLELKSRAGQRIITKIKHKDF